MEHATYNYPYFAMGMMVRKYDWLASVLQNKYTAALSLVAFGVLFLLGGDTYHLPAHSILSFLVIFASWNLMRRCGESSNKLLAGIEYCGRHSLEVYLFHYFFIAFVDITPMMRWGEETGNMLIVYVGLFALAAVVALLSILLGKVLHQYRLLDRFVFGNFGK